MEISTLKHGKRLEKFIYSCSPVGKAFLMYFYLERVQSQKCSAEKYNKLIVLDVTIR